jgi:hypothetical protein
MKSIASMKDMVYTMGAIKAANLYGHEVGSKLNQGRRKLLSQKVLLVSEKFHPAL